MKKTKKSKKKEFTFKKCICGNKKYTIFRKGIYNRLDILNCSFVVVKCKKCKLMRTLHAYSSKQNVLEVKSNTPAFKDETWAKVIAKEIAALLAKGSRILDLGCSGGNLVQCLGDAGFLATGCDINYVAVRTGRKKGRNLLEGPIMKQEFETNFFDMVVCNHTLEHVRELDRTIQEVCRILKKGGLFLIMVPYYAGLLPRLMGDHWIGWFVPQHVWHFNKRTLRKNVLENGNFEVQFLRSKGATETQSLGFKGFIKAIMVKLANMLNIGDQIEALYIKK